MAQQVRAKRKKKSSLQYVATCSAGLEELVAGEISLHGGEIVELKPGAVTWQGNLEAGYRLCLWSRFASRILLQIAEFIAPDPDSLYREAGKIDWDEHFNPKDTFAVFCTLSESTISHSKFAALRIKDAIVDQFRSRRGKRPNVDTQQPGMRINLHVQGNLATLSLDLSGDSLHRRGYRVASVEAPMKETLAAAVVHLAGLTQNFSPEAVLLDPMCGSGTLLIEAAMIFGDSAPGLLRKTFGFMYWPKHDERLWEKLVNEALEREDRGMEKNWPRIIGYDADPLAVSAARRNIQQAGLEDKIEVAQRQLADLDRPAESGLALINPPYGERLSDREEVKYLYRCIGNKFSQHLYGWQIGFFASNPDFSGSLGINWTSTAKLFNGPIKCKLHCGTAEEKHPFSGYHHQLHDCTPPSGAEEFAACLKKNCENLFPWAEQENISCFRMYDADLPEYNIAVDLYEEWVHVINYGQKKDSSKQSADTLQSALAVIRNMLDVPHSRLFLKTRNSKRQKNQQPKKKGTGKLHEVHEDNCLFLMNFTDDYDIGLALDRRNIRRMIGRLSHGKKCLNLFCHSGTETIHAISGGAIASTTVDNNVVCLQRLKANMALNGFGGPQHETIQKDVFSWLKEGKGRYGLIIVGPPSLNQPRHSKTTWNLQQDHQKMLQLAMKKLSRDGLLIFTVNSRNFKLSNVLEKEFNICEITDQTIPKDFEKSPRPHRCWEFRHWEGVDS